MNASSPWTDISIKIASYKMLLCLESIERKGRGRGCCERRSLRRLLYPSCQVQWSTMHGHHLTAACSLNTS